MTTLPTARLAPQQFTGRLIDLGTSAKYRPLPAHSEQGLSKRTLITGITGPHGAYLAQFLLPEDYDVHGLVRRSSSSDVNLAKLHWLGIAGDVRIIDGNLRDISCPMRSTHHQPGRALQRSPILRQIRQQPILTGEATAMSRLLMRTRRSESRARARSSSSLRGGLGDWRERVRAPPLTGRPPVAEGERDAEQSLELSAIHPLLDPGGIARPLCALAAGRALVHPAQALIFSVVLAEVLGGRGQSGGLSSLPVRRDGGARLVLGNPQPDDRNLHRAIALAQEDRLSPPRAPDDCPGKRALTHVLLFGAIALILILILILVFGIYPGAAWLAIPLGVLMISVLAFGIGVFVRVLNLFSRDVSQGMAVVVQLWFWVTPIVYPCSIVPEGFKGLVELNPMTPLVGTYPYAVLFDRLPTFDQLWSAAGTLTVQASSGVFRRVTDVLVLNNVSKRHSTYPSTPKRFASWFAPSMRLESEFVASRDISFRVAQGEAVAVIGLNGAGKSTLLKMTSGTVRPSSGTVAADGRISVILDLGLGLNRSSPADRTSSKQAD